MPEGRSESFDAFFRKNVISVIRYVIWRGADPDRAEDAVEDAMVKLYEQWDDIRFPLPWLRETAYWTARGRLAAGPGAVELNDIAELDASPALRHHDMDPMCEQESAARVHELLRELPERRRMVLGLWLDGCGDDEIADELQISEATVRSHKRYALRDVAATLRLKEVDRD